MRGDSFINVDQIYLQAYEDLIKLMSFILKKYCKEKSYRLLSLYWLKAQEEENTPKKFGQIYYSFKIKDVQPDLSIPGNGKTSLKRLSSTRCMYIPAYWQISNQVPSHSSFVASIRHSTFLEKKFLICFLIKKKYTNQDLKEF